MADPHPGAELTILVFVISFVVGLYITIADTAFDYIVRWLSGFNA